MSRDFSTVVDDFGPERSKNRAPGLHFDIKRFLSLRLLPVVLIWAVLAGPFMGMGWFAAPDVYTASAVLHFRSVGGGILDQGAGVAGTVSYEKFVGTELAKLRGNTVLNSVLELPEIQELPSVRAEFDKLAFLQSTISSSKSRDSELVTVFCTMKSRDEALAVLSAVMDLYHEQVLFAEAGKEFNRIEVLNGEINNRNTELNAQRKRIEEMEGLLGFIGGGNPENSKEAEQYRDKYLLAQERVTGAENKVADVEDTLRRIEALRARHLQSKSAPIYEFDIEANVVRDPRVSSAQGELNMRESRVSLLSQSHRDGHPELAAAKRELDAVRANVSQKEQIARLDALNTIAGRFELDLENAKRGLADENVALAAVKGRYDDYVNQQQEKQASASAERARLQTLKEQADANRHFIAGLEDQVRKIQLEFAAPARVSVASKAYAPPSKDRKVKYAMAAMGFMAALGVGLVFGVARELLDQQIRSRQDLARISDLPTIASIPHLSEDRLLGDVDCGLLMAQNPNSIIADEYRRILARILYPEDNAAEISSLLIVSASTQEGKTTVATNLAVALEQANRRVLLIDLSSQKPDVERTFGLEPAQGLSELLDDELAREELIRRTAFENLGVVGPGQDADALAGRLASREMIDFLEWADERFDHIIVDTPPLLLMSDAKLLAPAMDGVLFVVGVGTSTLGMVCRCLNDLEQLRANVIGVVINGIRNMRGGYLRKNQDLYYAYTERAARGAAESTIPEINVLDEEAPEAQEAEVVLLPYDDRDK